MGTQGLESGTTGRRMPPDGSVPSSRCCYGCMWFHFPLLFSVAVFAELGNSSKMLPSLETSFLGSLTDHKFTSSYPHMRSFDGHAPQTLSEAHGLPEKQFTFPTDPRKRLEIRCGKIRHWRTQKQTKCASQTDCSSHMMLTLK